MVPVYTMRNYTKSFMFPTTILLFSLLILLPKVGLLKVPGTYIQIRYDDFIFVLMAFSFLLLILKRGYFVTTHFTKVILLFISVTGLSLVDGILQDTVSPMLAGLFWFRTIQYVSLLYITINLLTKQNHIIIAFKSIACTFFIAVIYGIFQIFGLVPIFSTMDATRAGVLVYSEGLPAMSIFAGHYDFAVDLVLAILISTGLSFLMSRMWKATFGLLAFLFFTMLLFTTHRTSLAAFFVILPLFCLWNNVKRSTVFAIALLFVLTFPLLLSSFIYEIRTGEHNLDTAEFYDTSRIVKYLHSDVSFMARLEGGWPRALEKFNTNRLLGSGPSALGEATDSYYLRLLGESGILGVLGFTLLMYTMIKFEYRALKNSNSAFNKLIYSTTLAWTLCLLLISITLDVFSASKIAYLFWTMSGMAIAQHRLDASTIDHGFKRSIKDFKQTASYS